MAGAPGGLECLTGPVHGAGPGERVVGLRFGAVARHQASSTKEVQVLRIRSSRRAMVRRGAAELVGDLVVGIALHPAEGDLTERVVVERVEQPLALLRHHGGEFRARAVAGDPLQSGERTVLPATLSEEDRLVHHAAAAALLPSLALGLGHGLARRDDDEELPEVVPVGELGESAPRHAPAETVERAARRRLPRPRPPTCAALSSTSPAPRRPAWRSTAPRAAGPPRGRHPSGRPASK